MEGLTAQGATSFVWSVGGLFPVGAYSAALGKRFGVDVVCASGGAKGVVRRRPASGGPVVVRHVTPLKPLPTAHHGSK